MATKQNIESLIGEKTVDVTYQGDYSKITKENLKLSEVSNSELSLNPEYYSKIILKGDNDRYKTTLFPGEIIKITDSITKNIIYPRQQGGKQKPKTKNQKPKTKKSRKTKRRR
jgi:hypothetical protein